MVCEFICWVCGVSFRPTIDVYYCKRCGAGLGQAQKSNENKAGLSKRWAEQSGGLQGQLLGEPDRLGLDHAGLSCVWGCGSWRGAGLR